ncbi:type VI secretion system lipoprotein TssJ [Sodalis sp. RH21]|uniref:type VI secretion system lipoprotein TssJ n=1 Tax=unclassified Sodalis (in: enterobacteria) TaxID=2636512 RepID=UPI0039B4B7C1
MRQTTLPRRYFSRIRTSYYLLILAAVILIAGCAADDNKPVNNTLLTFTSSGLVNNGAPLKITILQLTHQCRFLAGDYYDLQGDANKVLAEHLLGKNELFLMPDDAEKLATAIAIELAPGVRYLGIFAEYKGMAHKTWRLAVALPALAKPLFLTRLWTGPRPDEALTIEVSPAGLRYTAAAPGDR